jgi:hypothetical protein
MTLRTFFFPAPSFNGAPCRFTTVERMLVQRAPQVAAIGCPELKTRDSASMVQNHVI